MNSEKLKVKVHPDYTALVMVDMQRDYCCEGGVLEKMGFDINPSRELAPRLNEFVNQARRILKFIVHLRMELNPSLRSPALAEHYERVGLQRKHDPSLSEFCGVTPKEGEVVIPKYRYSGFVSTYFDRYLRSNGIKTLVLTGLSTNVCVESTLRAGFFKNYYIVCPQDCVATYNHILHEATLQNISYYFGVVTESRKLCDIWAPRVVHQRAKAPTRA